MVWIAPLLVNWLLEVKLLHRKLRRPQHGIAGQKFLESRNRAVFQPRQGQMGRKLLPFPRNVYLKEFSFNRITQGDHLFVRIDPGPEDARKPAGRKGADA